MAGVFEGVVSGVRSGEYVLCGVCGFEKRADEFVECLCCAMRSERLALALEVNQLREEVRELWGELGRVRDDVGMARQEMSVRPKDRSEIDKVWPVVGASRAVEDREDRSVVAGGKGVSRRLERVEGARARSFRVGDGSSGKLTLRRKASSQEWTVVGRDRVGTGSAVRASSNDPVICRNRFSPLDEAEGGMDDVIEVPDESERVEVGRGVNELPEVLVVGDSMVRYLDREFCEKERKKRMRVCYPGAGVNDVKERYENVVNGSARDSVVVLHVGTNDVDRVRSEELMARYRCLLEKVRDSGRRCVVSGVLPRCQAGSRWHSRAIGMNERVQKMCEEMGLSFMDEWREFSGRKELFAMDGVHLSRLGVKVLSDCLERAVRDCVSR